jgi:ESS family glutamate:Na+ symporter
METGDTKVAEETLSDKKVTSTLKSYTGSIFAVFLSMALGAYVAFVLNKTGATFPYYVGGVFAGALVRFASDRGIFALRNTEIDNIGNVSVNLFLALALMNLKLWELLKLAIPMIVILAVQTVILLAFSYYVVFKVLGKDYEASVMVSGYVGMGLGQAPNAVANMATITSKHGPAPNAWFMLTVIMVIILNIFNPLICSLIMSYY